MDAVLRVNIPFLQRELPCYRGHLLVGDRPARNAYLRALEAEAEVVGADVREAGLSVGAILIDGPMPSIMSPDGLGSLGKVLRSNFPLVPYCPVSIVATPNTVGVPALTGWGQGGINHVLLTADSLQPLELEALGRPFNEADIQNAVLFLDRFHVRGVDVRLLYGIPGQTPASLMRSLRSLEGIDVPAITLEQACLDNLPVTEDGTTCGVATEADQSASGLLEAARERLTEYGYEEYLPGRFAKAERYRDPFAAALADGASVVGLGIDAESRFAGLGYVNTADYNAYVEHPSDPAVTVARAWKLDTD